MGERYAGAEEAITQYFEDVVYGIKDHTLAQARPSNVIDETNRKEDSVGAAIGSFVSSLGGDAFDDFVMSAARGTVNDVADDVVDDQRDAVFAAARLKAQDKEDSDAYKRKRQAFANRADAWASELNPAAQRELNRAMRNGFDDVTDNLAYFLEQEESFDGGSFDDLLAQTPREESEERLYSLVDYVTELRQAFESCDHVYSEQENPVGMDRVHFKQEATRIMDEVETYVEQEIDATLDRAYGDTA